MMKKRWILLLLLALANMNVLLFAQRNNDRRRAELEENRAKRVTFLTKAIGLTTDEAKGFWSLYNELQEKKFQLNRQLRRDLSQFSGNERNKRKHTENEYKEIVSLYIQFKVKEAKLDEEYILKFAKVISYEKIFKYQQAELQFARELLEQRGGRDQGRRNGR